MLLLTLAEMQILKDGQLELAIIREFEWAEALISPVWAQGRLA